MRRTRVLKLALACGLAASAAGCLGTVRPANVSGQCRALGNELALAADDWQVDEVFEAGVAIGCWTRPKGR